MGPVKRWSDGKVTMIILIIAIKIILLSKVLALEQSLKLQTIEELVKEYSPLVWLAPGERFLPMSVDEFLKHVHPELPDSSIKPIYDLNDDPDKYVEYYSELKELEELKKNILTNRIKRNYKNLGNESPSLLPTGNLSEKWFLVTNKPIDTLKQEKDSFIYGKDPNIDSNVPIYAVVTICEDIEENSLENHIFETKKIKIVSENKNNRYIPVSLPRSFDSKAPIHIVMAETVTQKEEVEIKNDTKPSIDENLKIEGSSNIIEDSNVWSNQKPSTDWQPSNLDTVIKYNTKPLNKKLATSFFVDYWMFYPYSAGKIMCSIDLGPLGPIPIPLVFGFCLGTKKEFGGHIGDWEHVSLYFPSAKLMPTDMYVSAHDAGAYYTYQSRTGTFDFRKQETRKGIFQKPNFPKTVRTSKNHPVLFSAEGSHGLWTAPGKHRYVRVPRLYDINGFGIPWKTWDNIDIFYSNNMEKDPKTPNWLKFRGKWGNQKSKCHPLTNMGLHLCEVSDGPTGIPKKVPHFQCAAHHTSTI
uniref:CSON013536 protein n=1 Tax=Culicoides sonorensis TaxID=179676 RepID=A0A336M905_CULSO